MQGITIISYAEETVIISTGNCWNEVQTNINKHVYEEANWQNVIIDSTYD